MGDTVTNENHIVVHNIIIEKISTVNTVKIRLGRGNKPYIQITAT